jgi:hypothetical protein
MHGRPPIFGAWAVMSYCRIMFIYFARRISSRRSPLRIGSRLEESRHASMAQPGSDSSLATRILGPAIATRGVLRGEVGLRGEQSRATRTYRFCKRLALSRRVEHSLLARLVRAWRGELCEPGLGRVRRRRDPPSINAHSRLAPCISDPALACGSRRKSFESRSGFRCS